MECEEGDVMGEISRYEVRNLIDGDEETRKEHCRSAHQKAEREMCRN